MNSMDGHDIVAYRSLSPQLREIAIDTASRVAALNREELDRTISVIDAMTHEDDFLARDADFPLSKYAEDLLINKGRYEKEMKKKLALRITRRRAAALMGFDPIHPESYSETIHRDDFRITCNFVAESIVRLV